MTAEPEDIKIMNHYYTWRCIIRELLGGKLYVGEDAEEEIKICMDWIWECYGLLPDGRRERVPLNRDEELVREYIQIHSPK